jgi:transcriptional regulator with XRE-family HTH domain
MRGFTFGKLIKKKRLEKEQSLREFSRQTGYDIAYVSRLENDILTPPSEDGKLEKLAEAFSIKEGSKDWDQFLNLADVSRRKIPEEIDDKVLNYLPAFFRKASKKNVTKRDVNKLVKLIKGE